MNRHKVITLRVRAANRITFEAIRAGKKRIETRAASVKYGGIQAGDVLRFVCGKSEFKKKVKRVRKFKSIAHLLESYRPEDINPRYKDEAELRRMYKSFPSYTEKIRRYGLIVLEL